MTPQSAQREATAAFPMLAEDHWPEPIDVDFEDDAEDALDLEDWPLEEDVRRLQDER